MNLKTSVAVACFLPGRAKDLSAPLYHKSEQNRKNTPINLSNLATTFSFFPPVPAQQALNTVYYTLQIDIPFTYHNKSTFPCIKK
jgi:hypothetical protein